MPIEPPRTWSLDSLPLLGISVFTISDTPLDELAQLPFATDRVIHMATAARLPGHSFELLSACLRPHPGR